MTETTPDPVEQLSSIEPLAPIDPTTDDSGAYPTDREVLDDPEVDTGTDGTPEVIVTPQSP